MQEIINYFTCFINRRERISMIPLFKPHMPELNDIFNILYSGELTSGVYMNKFEAGLRDYFKNDNLLVVNSFSNAIYITLRTLGLKYGDEVIASPMGCLASLQPYLDHGIRIQWGDIDPNTGTLSPDSVIKKISKKTKAIIHNHFCGYPGYVNEINAIGKKYNILVINDCIEAFGSKYGDTIIGNDGADATVFSFGPVRILNTIEGGAIIFKDNANYYKAKLIRDLGIDRKDFRDNINEINKNYDVKQVGFSGMMNEINAYIGFCQLKYINGIIDKHFENACLWDEIFKNNSIYMPVYNKNTTPNYWVYGLFADNKIEAIQYFRDRGFYASGVHINLNRYSIFGEREKLIGVEKFYERFLAVPCGWWINSEEREKMRLFI